MAIFTGGSTDDTLTGTSSADTLTGNAGNDSMDGAGGADIYVYNLGDGRDTIVSSNGVFGTTAGADILKFGAGINMADVNAVLEGTTLVLTLTSNRGSIRINNYGGNSAAGRLRVQFNDGLEWNTDTINRLVNTDIETNGDMPDATDGADYYVGGAGNDLLAGGLGNDTFYGDSGDDVITGEGGQNVYYYGRGDGTDFIGIYTLEEGGVTQSDTVRLGSDITMADVSVVNDASNIALQIRGSLDQVQLLNAADDPSAYKATVTFADGTKWDTAALIRKLELSNDSFLGTSGADQWDGGLGNDTATGGDGADSLYGGTGNDSIDGGLGNDTYYFGLGDGKDTIVAGTGDKLLFGSAIDITDIDVKQEGSDVVLRVLDTLDSVRLKGYAGIATASRPTLRFADGTIWDGAALERKINGAGQAFAGTAGADSLDGGQGNDTLTGAAGQDTLYGDAGNDSMDGGEGADTYVFGRGDGLDTVIAGTASGGVADRVRFGHGIMLTDFTATKSGNDLILMLPDGKEGLRVQNYFGVAIADRTRLEFKDGVVWDAATIDRKVTASNDALTGSAGNETLDGGLGDDTLSALEGTNVYYGDAGNDSLVGGDGINTFYFGYGDGQDTLVASNTFAFDQQDLIQFGTGITAADVDAVIDGVDLVFKLRATGDSLRFTNFVGDPDGYSALMRFGDGSQLNLQQIKGMYQGVDDIASGSKANDMLHSGMGQDSITGLAGDDTLYGDGGADTLDGGEGADVLLYGRGDGRDVIIAGSTQSSGDQLVLASDLDASSIGFSKVGQNLVLSVRGTLETATLKDYFNVAEGDRMAVRFADGLLLDGAAVSRKVGLTATTLTATTRDDWLSGNQQAETITGLGGNDTLYGDGGADSLDGGAGSDVYLFGRGNGRDTVAGGAADRLRFAREISMADVDASLSGTDLILSVKGGKDVDTVTVKGYTSLVAADRLRVDFQPGGTWDPTTIDRKITSSNDALTGTAAADLLDGGLGNDTITAAAGDDTLYGDAGDDQLNGGLGLDTYIFGRGDGADRILTGTAIERRGDVVAFGSGISMADVDLAMSGTALVVSLKGTTDKLTIDSYTTGATTDRISLRFSDGATLSGAAIATLLAREQDGLWGGSGNDAYHGGAGDDVMAGMDGEDTLYGDTGNDWMGGGYGSDTYYFGRGDGIDTITAGSSDPAGSQDRLILGADLAPRELTFTRSGADLLVGIAGTGDRAQLQGWFDRAAADRTVVQLASGWGWDQAALERKVTDSADEVQGGAGEDLVDGGLGDDMLFGLAGNDYLVGDAGADQLDGGTGADTMAGGFGNDTYIVDSAADVIVDDGGIDFVYSSISYTTGNGVEYAELTGEANLNITAGNNNGVQIWGNTGNNLVTGADGADELAGGVGGLDTLVGGKGDDFYYVFKASDVVTEKADEGFDQVQAMFSGYKLADNVENLTLLAAFAVGTGNGLDNGLFGNAASNTLSALDGHDFINALGGHDMITGGKGDDTMSGGTGNDTYHYNPDDGYDYVANYDAKGTDTLAIHGATESQIWFKMVGRDLTVSVIGRDGDVTVAGWGRGASYQIDNIKLDNGKVLTAGKVASLVSAMAGFTAPAAGQTTLPANYQTTLNPVIASSWV